MMNKFISLGLIFVTGLVIAGEPDSRTVTEGFKDWQLVCVERSSEKQCEVKQTLVNQEKKVLAVLAVGNTKDNKQMLQITLPLLLDLTKPVKISIDKASPLTVPYNFCNNMACFVLTDNKAIFNAFHKGTGGVISARPMGSSEDMKLNFSLKGFSDGVKRL